MHLLAVCFILQPVSAVLLPPAIPLRPISIVKVSVVFFCAKIIIYLQLSLQNKKNLDSGLPTPFSHTLSFNFLPCFEHTNNSVPFLCHLIC